MQCFFVGELIDIFENNVREKFIVQYYLHARIYVTVITVIY